MYRVFQDTLGFVWFATANDGLVRLEGTETRSFGPIPFDTTSLGDSHASDIISDGTGGMWVTTATSGLHHYDPAREAFQRIASAAPVRQSTLAQDEDGVLWIGTRYEGLVRYDPATGESVRYTTESPSATALPDDGVNALLLDRSGSLWIGTSGGLARLDRDTGALSVYRPQPNGPDGLPAARVNALHQDANGQIWVGTVGGGVAAYDPANDAFVPVPDEGSKGARRDEIHALFSDPMGVLWIGSEAGLDRYDPQTGIRTPYRHDIADPTSLRRGAVFSLFLDHSGVLWVGGEYGVSFFKWAPSPFQTYGHNPDDPNSLDSDDVLVVYEDRAGVLWAGTDVGLNRIDRETGRITRYAPDPADPTRLATGLVMGIVETLDDAFWVVGRGGGLQRFDRETGRVVERFSEIPGDPTSLLSELPWWVLEDQQGRTWIPSGGAGCLSQMHRDTGTFTRLCHDPDDPNTPAHNFSRYMVEGDDGALWLGTWGGGLDRIDPATGAFTHYRHDPTNRNSPSSDVLVFVGNAEEGGLWLGTVGAGLSHFDPTTETFTHYTPTETDLDTGTILGILPDDTGRLWLSTGDGLIRFDPATAEFRRFGIADGLQISVFHSGASHRSPSGELFFGGLGGVTAFFPDRVASDPRVPPVVLTEIQVDDETIRTPGPEAPIEVALPYAREIRLRPHQRDLEITFAALHYVDPTQNRYRHQLVGYDDGWSATSTMPTASYPNLAPGRYTFRVMAANSDGVWNTEGATIAVIVEPRWFETWWAFGIYALMTVGLAATVVRVRQNRLRMQHQLEIESVEAAQLRQIDQAKSAFFANVSHEFRTPLTLTLGPLDDVLAGEQGEIPDAASASLSMARRNAGRVLDLINQMLDVARLEAGHTVLQARSVDLVALVRTHLDAFAALAAQKDIAVEVLTPDTTGDVMADPEHLGTILSNLLSNAFKFTPEHGTVRVSVDGNATSARVTVRDSGPGIPAVDLPHVFDRFYQVRNDRAQRPLGTGIGLALAHELAALHGGSLTAESDEGFGSSFTLSLPLGRAHLAPDQIVEAPMEEETESRHPARPTPHRQLEEAARVTDMPEEDPTDDVLTILVVEDHPDIRTLVRSHLERAGYRVVEAPDGETGLETARQLVPDLILSDVMMPRMDGLEFCRAIKADPATDFIPVILLTAKAAQEDKLQGLREHADAYLTKPFDPAELLARVEALIALRTRLRERFRTEGIALVMGEEPTSTPLHARAVEVEPTEDVFLKQVREAIESNLEDPTFTVQALAEAVGVSRGHLHRQLVALTGQTPSEAMRTMRLERAAQLLAAGAGTVSEVAYASGFKSVSHFSTLFTAFAGCPPSTYRDRNSGA